MMNSGVALVTGVPRSYENALRQDPAVRLCSGPYGDPGGLGVPYERGTPVLVIRPGRGAKHVGCDSLLERRPAV